MLISSMPFSIIRHGPLLGLLKGHDSRELVQLFFPISMSKSYEVPSKKIVLSFSGPIVYSDVWISMIPTLKSIPQEEHPSLIMISCNHHNINWSDGRAFIYHLHQQLSSQTKGFLPTSVLLLGGSMCGGFLFVIYIEEVIAD